MRSCGQKKVEVTLCGSARPLSRIGGWREVATVRVFRTTRPEMLKSKTFHKAR